MRRWSEIADRIAATTKTSEKTSILAAYLAGLEVDTVATVPRLYEGLQEGAEHLVTASARR